MMSFETQNSAGGRMEAMILATSPRTTTARPDSQTNCRTVGTLRSAESRSRQLRQNSGRSLIPLTFESAWVGEKFHPGHWKRPRGTQSRGHQLWSNQFKANRTSSPNSVWMRKWPLRLVCKGSRALPPLVPKVLLLMEACPLHPALCLRALHECVPYEARPEILRHHQDDPRINPDHISIVPVLQRIESIDEPVLRPCRRV